jgi:hypothetical protein
MKGSRPRPTIARRVRFLLAPTYLPADLLREIFLYSIEANHTEHGQLASVCRHWQTIITSTGSLWSTLRVGTWTDRERVTAWLQKAEQKNVIIDTQRNDQVSSNALPLSALQDALAYTHQWRELTISSFPPDDVVSQLGFQVASPMNVLKVLHIAAECTHSPSFAHLLNLVPTEVPLRVLRLYSPFASTYFLQPRWFSVLRNLTVLIVSGKDMDEPFELLPTFTQLRTFEADHLRFPFYGPNANLPILYSLRKLHLRACSIQWMAGREFPCLEECAILLPHHWQATQRHEVQFPSCKKLTYRGHPMTAVQYFHVPEMRAMELRSHDCNEKRFYQHLRHLCRVDGRFSNLTTLHLTLQCSEQVLIKVLKYLVPLQKLVISIAYPSPSWQIFLESLAAEPSTKKWVAWGQRKEAYQEWKEWCDSLTWHANILPHLKYLGIQCPKGFSQSDFLDNSPFLRLIGWTRAYLTPPLEHLKVWKGRGGMDDTAVDYISTGYLDEYPGVPIKEYDAMLVTGMATLCMNIDFPGTPMATHPLFIPHSTVLFRRLQRLEIFLTSRQEITILPYVEQIKTLVLWGGFIPEYPLDLDLPFTHTLQSLTLQTSAPSWMLGRTFNALLELYIDWSSSQPKDMPRYEGPQAGLPACTKLELRSCPKEYLRFFSCPNVQILHWSRYSRPSTVNLTALNSSHDFAFSLSCLQQFYICTPPCSWLDSLLQFVFCDAWEQGVWRDMRSVELEIRFDYSYKLPPFFDQTAGYQQRYGKWWKTFTVTKKGGHYPQVNINASM